ncbi:hypothetical protein Bbelb_131640, partial [Branchiostoma belcheri]
ELKQTTQLINHDAGHRDDFTIQKRAIEKELVAQRGTRSDHHNGKNQSTKSSPAKNDSSNSRLTHNGSTKDEHLDGQRGSFNSSTFSKLLSISSSRHQESDHVSRESNSHLADSVNEEQVGIKSTASKIQNGKTSTQEGKATRSPVESRMVLPSVRFTYTKTKDQKTEARIWGISVLVHDGTNRIIGLVLLNTADYRVVRGVQVVQYPVAAAVTTTTGSSSGRASLPNGRQVPSSRQSTPPLALPSWHSLATASPSFSRRGLAALRRASTTTTTRTCQRTSFQIQPQQEIIPQGQNSQQRPRESL